VAWAIWLWREADLKWRLQALSMLEQSAKEQWVAGYIVHSVLDEFPVLVPSAAPTPAPKAAP
jgi:hypothetical protein